MGDLVILLTDSFLNVLVGTKIDIYKLYASVAGSLQLEN
jgi:hypothetical protein